MRVGMVAVAALAVVVVMGNGCGCTSKGGGERAAKTSQALGDPIHEVLTQGGNDSDNNRANYFVDESLTIPEVSSSSTPLAFGRVTRRQVRGSIYGQPLVVSGIDGCGARQTCVIVATMHNRIYAFDMFDTSLHPAPTWMQDLQFPNGCTIQPCVFPVATPATLPDPGNLGVNNGNIQVEIGIISTPVVGPPLPGGIRPLYVVARARDVSLAHHYYLYQLNVGNGHILQATELQPTLVPPAAGCNVPTFDPSVNNQRAGLLVAPGPADQLGGNVYMAFGSHGDQEKWHGWVLAYNALTLAPTGVWAATPCGHNGGGIWHSPAPAERNGEVFVGVGNDDSAQPPLEHQPCCPSGCLVTCSNAGDYGEGVVKLDPGVNSLNVAAYYREGDTYTRTEDLCDADFGTPGVVLVPGANFAISSGKDAILRLLDTGTLELAAATNNHWLIPNAPLNAPTFPPTGCPNGSKGLKQAHVHPLALFSGTLNDQAAEILYAWPDISPLTSVLVDPIKGFVDENGKAAPLEQRANPGPTDNALSLSSPDPAVEHAVGWASTTTAAAVSPNQATVHGELTAFRAYGSPANNQLQDLWKSSYEARSDVGIFAKFNRPTIANGAIFVSNFQGIDPNDYKSVPIVGFTATESPALLGGSDDVLTLAFTGTTGGGHIDVSTTRDGTTFTSAHELPDTSFEGPTAAVVDFQIGSAFYEVAALAYAGTDEHQTPYLLLSSDRTFSGEVTESPWNAGGKLDDKIHRHGSNGNGFHGETAVFAPTVAAGGGRLWFFWVGSDRKINWTTTTDGSTFTPKQTIAETSAAVVGAVIDPAVGNNIVHGDIADIAWGDSVTNDLKFARIPDPSSNTLAFVRTVAGATTKDRVELHRDPGGFLYLGYEGTDAHFNVITTEAGKDITTCCDASTGRPFDQSIYIEQATSAGFSLASWRQYVYVAWSGSEKPAHVNVAQLNAGSFLQYGLDHDPSSCAAGSICFACASPPSITFATPSSLIPICTSKSNAQDLAGTVRATSNCASAPQVHLTVSPATLAKGPQTIAWTATDAVGNSVTATEQVEQRPNCP